MFKPKLVEKLINGRVVEYPLDTFKLIVAEDGATYSVIDEITGEIPEGMVLKREGDMLVIDVNDETVARIDDYYDDKGAGFTVPDGSEAGGDLILSGGEAADVADGAVVWPTATDSGGISPWIWAGGAAILAGGAAVAIAASDDDDDDGGSGDAPPVLDSEASTSGATDVAAGANITLVFNEDIALGDSGTITLVNDDTGETITIDVADHDDQLSVSGNTLTIDPASDLDAGCSYHIEISSGALEDLAGNDYGGIDDATTFTFETAAATDTDTTAPTLGSSSPADGATDVGVGSNITLTFSEDIALGDSGTITLVNDDTGEEVEIDVSSHGGQLSVSGDTLTIDPSADLDEGSSYHVEVSAGAIEDAAGNDFAGIGDAATLNFETVTLADTTAPTLESFTPSDEASGVTIDSDITITFSEDIALGDSGTITLVNDTDPNDTITIDVANHNSQLSVDGDTLTIDPTEDMASDSTYHVEIGSGAIEDMAGNAFAGIGDSGTFNFDTESFAGDTSIVVFDLVEGVSSSHSGRSFAADVSYTIYIRVDSDSHELSTDGISGNADATWGTWGGAANLGADDAIILVGDDASNDVIGDRTDPVDLFYVFSSSPYLSHPPGMSWRSHNDTCRAAYFGLNRSYNTSMMSSPLLDSMILNRVANDYNSRSTVVLFTDHFGTTKCPNKDVTTLSGAYQRTVAHTILTSQGLA